MATKFTDAFKRVAAILRFSGDAVKCSNSSCGRISIYSSVAENPRERWMINVQIGDAEENARVNLCPVCVKEFFNLREEDYVALEKNERMIAEHNNEQRSVLPS